MTLFPKVRARTMTLVAGALALSLAVPAAVAQDAGGDPAANPMAAMFAKHKPGPGHAVLKAMEGKFSAKTSFFMAPGQPPQVSKGASINEFILGGRFMRMDYAGNAFGQPFAGVGTIGHNNDTNMYEFTWIDNISSVTHTYSGKASDDKKSITLTGTEKNDWGEFDVKHTYKIVDANSYRFEAHRAPKGTDTWMNDMIIEYTRAQIGPPANASDDDRATIDMSGDVMAAFKKLGSPGKIHKILASLEGTWKANGKTWPMGQEQPMEGTSVNKLVNGGRQLHQTFDCPSFMGQPFTGTTVMGYDQIMKRLEAAEWNSMSTSITKYEGAVSEDGKTMTLHGLWEGPVPMGTMKTKTVIQIDNENCYTYTRYGNHPQMGEYKEVELKFLRAK